MHLFGKDLSDDDKPIGSEIIHPLPFLKVYMRVGVRANGVGVF